MVSKLTLLSTTLKSKFSVWGCWGTASHGEGVFINFGNFKNTIRRENVPFSIYIAYVALCMRIPYTYDPIWLKTGTQSFSSFLFL